MKKNLIPRESKYWYFMGLRECVLDEKDKAQSLEDKKNLDKEAFELRVQALKARRSELKSP